MNPYLTFVLVGAGPTGVELAGAIAEFRNYVMEKDYPELKKDDVKIYLADFQPRVIRLPCRNRPLRHRAGIFEKTGR